MKWKIVNMEVMDDIFPDFVLQLVVVQVLQSPFNNFGTFCFFDDKDFLLWSFQTCFVQLQTGKKKKITCAAPILTKIKVQKHTLS